MKKIILISGKANSGKDTVADYIIEKLKEDNKVVKMPFAYYLKSYLCRFFDWDGEEKTPEIRDFLQIVGTDIIRDKFNWQDFHVNRVYEDILILQDMLDYVIIPDLRFKNEGEFMRDRFSKDVVLIHVERKDIDNITKLDSKQQSHKSENALGDIKHDFIISNDGTLWDLYNKIDSIMNNII